MIILKRLFILVTVILTISCSSKNRVEKPEVFINKEKMISILTDIHLADGLMNIPSVSAIYQDKDSIIAYMEVIEMQGISKSEFDENLEYYFIEKANVFSEIYEKVIDNLSIMEDEYLKKVPENSGGQTNLWTKQESFRFPDDGVTSFVDFNIPLEGLGSYTLSFKVNVFEDDQSTDLATEVYFWHNDDSELGVREMWDKHIYEKSTQSKVVKLEKNLVNQQFTHLRGKLFNHTPRNEHWEMHSSLSGISVAFRPHKQDAQSEQDPNIEQ